MSKQYNDPVQVASEKIQWQRDDVAAKIIDFEQARPKQSQRQFAIEQAVSRSTLQHWLARKESIDASPVLIEFLESPVGTAFVHRIVTAAHFTFTKDGVASIHNVSNFLKLSGLSPFVASSYSSQQRVSKWNKVVLQALKDLPVQVIQVSSAEGRGLINHTIKGLNAHHLSDCFHVPHEIGKGTSGALASGVKKAEKEYEISVKQAQKQVILQEKYDNQPKRPPGRRPDFDKKIELAKDKQDQAQSNLEIVRQNQQTVRQAKSEIGQVYHPFNTQTGAKQESQKVSELLELCFENIREATQDLSERCKQRVDKAHRVVKNMVATIAFFFSMVDLYMDNMQISDQDRQLMYDYLIPGFYLKQVARKEKDAERKSQIS